MAITALALLAGCASEASERRMAAAKPALTRQSAQHRSRTPQIRSSEKNDGIGLELAKGALDERDVDNVLHRHLPALVGCYDRAGPAQKYAAGNVLLRFFVAGAGEVSNVLILESNLGSYEVERCLVDEGRKIRFPPPTGRRATDFEYSLRFRSSEEIAVVDWDGDAVAKDVAVLARQLAACGPVGPGSVRAVVYIEPSGAIGSVGLASESPVDNQAAACVVEQVRKWRFPGKGAGRGQMVRTTFSVAPLPAAAPPAPRKSPRHGRRVPRV